jgi:hypothetical protein
MNIHLPAILMYQKKDVILAEQIISHVMKSQLIPKNFSPLWPAPHVQVLPKKNKMIKWEAPKHRGLPIIFNMNFV